MAFTKLKTRNYNKAGTNLIAIFKNNLFINSLLLLPYLILIRLKTVIYPSSYDIGEGDSVIFQWVFGLLPSAQAQSILAIIMVYLQAVYINRIAIKHRLSKSISLLPGLFYLILMSFFPDSCVLSPHLIANFFVLLGFSQLFKSYKRPNSADIVFNVGLLLAIAGLIVPTYSLLILVGFLGILNLRSLKLSEVMQYLSGTLTVVFLLVSIAYLLDIDLRDQTGKWMLSFNRQIFSLGWREIFPVILWLVLAIGMVLYYNKITLKKSIQVQKKIDILYWLLLFSGVSLLFNGQWFAWSIALYAFPACIFMCYFIEHIKNPVIQEVLHIAILSMLVFLHYW